MKSMSIYDQISKFQVVPVIAIENVGQTLPLADALIEGGLPVAEITFRTDVAAEVIMKLKKERSQLLVGAGTILTVENLRKAQDCGAAFGVAPGFNLKVAEESLRINFPFSPGVMTASDIENALSLGIKVLKFFPAEAAGGVKMLTALSTPYKHTGVKFMPTGCLNLNNFMNYLEMDSVIAIGGTWVARKEDIATGDWAKIKNNCKAIVEMLIKK